MSQPVLTVQAASTPAHAAAAVSTPLHLVRLPVDKSQVAVAFLRASARGVMDLIAHFWEGLGQTPPLQRADLHLVVAAAQAFTDEHIQMSQLDPSAFTGAMLYVPKAHRADILATHPDAAAALAAYICHHGSRLAQAAIPVAADAAALADQPLEIGQTVPTLRLTDLTGKQATLEMIAAELSTRASGSNGTTHANHPAAGTEGGQNGAPSAGTGAGHGAGMAIDFLTGDAAGIGWMVPLLLPLVHKRMPARQLINVVMQLPPEVPCGLDAHVRPARESDIPLLNRWRRLYKEERGIHFDADMDALVQNQRVFVYDLATELPASNGGTGAGGTPDAALTTSGGVVAVAKIDLDLKELVEIGGVFTFPEHRHHGYGAALMRDMAHRIRQAGKVPTLQVDESNLPALRMYEKAEWRAMGKLARVWLTG